MGWPVAPDGLTELLVHLHHRYAGLPPVLVTENGVAYDDVLVRDTGGGARVDDPNRIAYLDAHLRAVHAAIEAGVDVRGYCVWSLLDNFEWAEGYSKRFRLVHTDYPTRQRVPKATYHWFRQVLATPPRECDL